MWPSTLTQLIGFFAAIGAALGGTIQVSKWYLNGLEEKAKSKDQANIEIAKSKDNLEIAKYKDNVLTAAQVVQLMTATQEVKDHMMKVKSDIVQLEERNEEQNENLLNAIDKLEINFNNFQDSFQKFLIARLNQFDQTLLK